jgi:hypothetical protein
VLISTESRLDRSALRMRYLNNRNRSAELFALVTPGAYEDRPIPLRHPVVFYEGHLPAFSFNKLVREALGGASIDADLERLFERGIDPSDSTDAARHARSSWPEKSRVQAFGALCDAAVLRALAKADLTDGAASPLRFSSTKRCITRRSCICCTACRLRINGPTAAAARIWSANRSRAVA